ncbi:hypothetical protein [Terrabacter sp. RAF57]|uniref:hypothetical protein n=1 Tax=Terrabacter sp. RAF57 TaxID=3233063 RepID=UPI003F9A72FE
MDADWAGVGVTILIAAATGGWAVLRWSGERRADRQQKAELTDALYLLPFVTAAEDLQSRLYNLLHNNGLMPLRAQDPRGRYAGETMFLLARFFAWEQQLLRFTHLAGDPGIVAAARQARKVLASDALGLDPWCFFRTTQTALGQAVVVWREGAGGFADTISVVEFERLLSDGLAEGLGIQSALDALRNATVIEDLGEGTLRRLEELRVAIEALLDAVDDHVARRRGGVSVLARAGGRSG